jgi:thioredoxin reductase (NADPH)
MKEEPVRNITILGSGPAGLTAAIYAARANLKPLVVEGLSAGGQLMITSDVENYPGFPKGILGPELMVEFRQQAERFGTEFLVGDASRVELTHDPILVHVENQTIETRTLILATGASAKWLGLESETALYGRGVSACATCDGFFFRDRNVVVVGGGDTALEEALYLTRMAKQVSVIHRRDQLRGSKIMQERAFKNEKIGFIWDSVVDEILDPAAGKVTGIRLRNVKTNEVKDTPTDGVFIAIGHQPNSKLFEGQLDMDERGYVHCRPNSTYTNVPGVFACGDLMDPIYRQAVTAAGTGCMAAIDAERWLEEHAGH